MVKPDTHAEPWDALVITAANVQQAEAYEEALERRRRLDLLGDIRHVMVVPDPEGRRIGSGGGTISAVVAALNALLVHEADENDKPQRLEDCLAGRRILIIHAGGDSQRLPSYGACGKLFIPLPGPIESAEPLTLFDRQLPVYRALPVPLNGAGQVVVASGDVLLLFDPSKLDSPAEGVTGYACNGNAAQAKGHGVYCADFTGLVHQYLQKPSNSTLNANGVHDDLLLDIGVMSFDHIAAGRLLAAGGYSLRADEHVEIIQTRADAPIAAAVNRNGVDIYREVACALGADTTECEYIEAVRLAGSTLPESGLQAIFDTLNGIQFSCGAIEDCRFLHLGTTRHVIDSGAELAANMGGRYGDAVVMNCDVSAAIPQRHAWIENCTVSAPISLGGRNLLTGVDFTVPVKIEADIAIDVAPAAGAYDGSFFVRIYGVDDDFKARFAKGEIQWLNQPLEKILLAMGATPDDVWPQEIEHEDRSLWNARLFPLVQAGDELSWLWMQNPDAASEAQHSAWRDSKRFSMQQMSLLIDRKALMARRRKHCIRTMQRAVPALLSQHSQFSAGDLAAWLDDSPSASGLIDQLVGSACRPLHLEPPDRARLLESGRILHTLGSAIEQVSSEHDKIQSQVKPAAEEALTAATGDLAVAYVPRSASSTASSLEQATIEALEVHDDKARLGLLSPYTLGNSSASGIADFMRDAAFRITAEAISSTELADASVRSIELRSDEIVWGRSPARLDLAGGWSDTPPYTLEYGGSVVNSAVCLNGQQPIHVYIRRIEEPVIKIGSIDLGTNIVIRDAENLLDYRNFSGEFALVKAALVMIGFAPSSETGSRRMLKQLLAEVGGGLEITTLCAIPKGSGLGTSSILGATILASLARAVGRKMSHRQLFEAVLTLEQMLTTGGGWQDQVGGVLPGTKYVATRQGIRPDPVAHYLPSELICPQQNGGSTLLYYTGITRTARNILQQVVGRYLDRDRATMRTLGEIAHLADEMRDAVSRKEGETLGRLIGRAWEQNKRLDPDSTTPQIEAMLGAIRGEVLGAKLLGAGGGGFLMIACKSPDHAGQVRRKLSESPLNERARFFDFTVSDAGLEVTTS